jgi:iron complex outermembrane receptor protein
MQMKNLVLSILVFLPATIFGQTVLTIVDEKSAEPIPYVSIKLNDQRTFVADEDGKVTITLGNPAEGVLTHVAFERKSFTIPSSGDHTIGLARADNTLTEVVVSSFETERPLLVQAAAISRISESELYRFNETSIVHAFNTKPGIRIEERAPASYRISIRGSSLRSPFGVRNVKVYWNDMPFTAADGTTPLNILDLSNIENTEIIKGPAGSIYGAGNGGVISFTSKQDVQENRISTDLPGGFPNCRSFSPF